MMNTAVTPSILIDIKKNRIRIHKNTIHALGDPKYVLLLVNPKEATVPPAGLARSWGLSITSHTVRSENIACMHR